MLTLLAIDPRICDSMIRKRHIWIKLVSDVGFVPTISGTDARASRWALSMMALSSMDSSMSIGSYKGCQPIGLEHAATWRQLTSISMTPSATPGVFPSTAHICLSSVYTVQNTLFRISMLRGLICTLGSARLCRPSSSHRRIAKSAYVHALVTCCRRKLYNIRNSKNWTERIFCGSRTSSRCWRAESMCCSASKPRSCMLLMCLT